MTSRREFILPDDETIRGTMQIDVLWCTTDDPETNVKGQVGHPFPSTDEGRNTFTQTRRVRVQTGNSYGNPTFQEHQEVTQVICFCSYHWEKQNPFQKAPEPTAAITHNEDYNQGWEDAQKHYTE